jgi:hypothetical protein
MIRAAAAAAFAALALLVPARVRAEAPPPTSDPVLEATQRAAEHWDGAPCRQVPTVSTTDVPAGSPPFAAMWTYVVEGPPPASCPIYINARVWTSWRTEDENFEAFCKLMVHEYGHLRGYPDQGARPGTVEYQDPTPARVPECERFRLYYGRWEYFPWGYRDPGGNEWVYESPASA